MKQIIAMKCGFTNRIYGIKEVDYKVEQEHPDVKPIKTLDGIKETKVFGDSCMLGKEGIDYEVSHGIAPEYVPIIYAKSGLFNKTTQEVLSDYSELGGCRIFRLFPKGMEVAKRENVPLPAGLEAVFIGYLNGVKV